MKPLVMLTCYDATFARLCAQVEGIDYLLVGDSAGMVIAGHQSTVPVTLDQMIYHTSAVARGLASIPRTSKLPLIADLPFGSYEDERSALQSSRRLIDAGASMVKLEGPCDRVIQALVSEGIEVCAHIGLTPQTIHDFKVQGKSESEAARLKIEAQTLERAGAQLLVLEMIPASLAKEISDAIAIPTIGIGAGPHCDGQVLVLYDVLGLNASFNPKFLKKFMDGENLIVSALKTFASEVKTGIYPDENQSFK